jgi:hypothetical protein
MDSQCKATPAATPEDVLAIQATLGRFQATKGEVQWRAVQRDALVVLTLTFIVGVYVAVDKIGAWVMLTPLPLMVVASMWMHHDRRIGMLAGGYIKEVLEPALRQYDGLIGLEDYLNQKDSTRSFSQRYHFTAIMSRLLFPGLQALALVTGLGVYIVKGPHTPVTLVAVGVGSVLISVLIAFTFVKVKHERHEQLAPEPPADETAR